MKKLMFFNAIYVLKGQSRFAWSIKEYDPKKDPELYKWILKHIAVSEGGCEESEIRHLNVKALNEV